MLALVLLASCGDDLPDAAGGSSTGSVGGASSPTGGHPDAPPQIVDIGQDALVLREGGSIVLIAVVRDPNGDVAGGVLSGPGEPGDYGAFARHGSDRWRAEVTWDEVHAQARLQFELEQALPFVVTFVDEAGHEARAEIELRAVCSGLTDTACDGACIDPQTSPEHCGACGAPCPTVELRGAAPTGGCLGGICQSRWSECMTPTGASDCATACAGFGLRCTVSGCDGSTVMRYEQEQTCEQGSAGLPTTDPCDADLGTAPAVRCCCG